MSAELEKASHSLVILPVGSLEQHGTEAPLGCDGLVADALCRKAGELTSIPVLPTLYYGCSYSHTSFPGTFSISIETYSKLLGEIISEAERNGFSNILIVSGHGGNRQAAEKAMAETRGTISRSYMGYWQLPNVQDEEKRLFKKPGYHITSSEVSMVWSLLSGPIPGAFTGAYPPAEKNMLDLSPVQWKSFYPDGGVGADLSDVSVEKGRILFDFITDSLVGKIREMKELF
jgi:creatinine amidohydrolase